MAKSVEIKVHDFDYRIFQTLNLIKRDFSKDNARIIKKYDNSNPLAWTIEVCGSCHYQLDPKNKKLVDGHYGRKGR